MAKSRKSAKSDLAIHGGKPLYTKPWRSGDFHFGAELRALERVLAGPALPLARGKQVMAYREQLQKVYGMNCGLNSEVHV